MSNPLPDSELKKLRELEKAATPGDWEVHMGWAHPHILNTDGEYIMEHASPRLSIPDAALIVAMRNALVSMLDEIERAREESGA